MIKHFTNFQEWKKAIEERGLIIRIDPPCHEGMHEDDPFEASFAVRPNNEDAELGAFSNEPPREEGGDSIPCGFLCDTEREFFEELNREYCDNIGLDP